MRSLFTFFLVLCALPAWAQVCPNPQAAPKVVLTVKQSPVTHDNSKYIHDLIGLSTTLAASSLAAAAGHKHVPLGLTEVKTRFTSSMESEVIRLRNGRYCASLRTLFVDFIFDDTTVYVATNLPRSSCIYREVLLHEYKHVEVDRQLLAQWRSTLEREAQNAARTVGIIEARSQNELGEMMKAKLEPQLRRTFQQLLDARDRAQAQIDTREEYERVSRSCNGEARKYVPAGLLE
jgi:hypothetical protein